MICGTIKYQCCYINHIRSRFIIYDIGVIILLIVHNVIIIVVVVVVEVVVVTGMAMLMIVY